MIKQRFITLALLVSPIGLFANRAIAAPALTTASRVGTNGIGPVQVGMTIKAAEAASGRQFKVDHNPREEFCTFASVVGLSGVNFMVIKGMIERVDIDNPHILTLRGAKMGNSEDQIKQLYPGQIETTPHPYGRFGSDHYLTFVPKDRADRDYRVIFETSQGQVKRYRAGRMPAVGYIEGCS